MENMVTVFLFGKKYEVPDSLTIMEAMEYSGYQLVRGCGCRNGFCGACATLYRIAGDRELKACLACSTRVENNMYVATLPFFPLVKEVYDMEKLKPTQTVMMQLYPEIYACVGCNACSRCRSWLTITSAPGHATSSSSNACRAPRSSALPGSFSSNSCGAGSAYSTLASAPFTRSPSLRLLAARWMRCCRGSRRRKRACCRPTTKRCCGANWNCFPTGIWRATAA